MSSCRAMFRMATPSAPLCDMKAMRPVRGRVGAKVASMRTAGSVLMTPMQFGPIIRIPYCRTRSPSWASNLFPTSPVSEKPAVITTNARHALLSAIIDDAEHPFARHDDDGQVHRVGNR